MLLRQNLIKNNTFVKFLLTVSVLVCDFVLKFYTYTFKYKKDDYIFFF